MDDRHALFQILMRKDLNPYAYQLRVADCLSEGSSVLLSAPTGAGKTWAALLGFLAGIRAGRPHADRTLYALPLRSLATGLFKSTSESCARVEDWGDSSRPSITIQTGEQKDDPFFQGDVVFSTIDQLLAGYLQIPLSLPPRLANINAGALVGSLVVLDEVHLLDPRRSLATVMEMGRRLHGLSQFLLMTATLSRPAREALAAYFGARLEGPTEEELSAMPTQAKKERRYHWRSDILTADAVIERHGGGRSLVICNTVQRSQELYNELVKLARNETQVFLLHSRFLPEDRQAVEKLLADYFGPDAKLTDAILVSTQVVEAGIDISADNLHTELCPANSLIQRAGRCARFPDRNKGDVLVYELPLGRKGGLFYLPYDKEQADPTREAVAELDGEILHFAAEQEMVDGVHAEHELEIIKTNRRNVQSIVRQKVLDAMAHNDRSAIADLIRDVDSVGVMVEETPSPVDLLGGLETIPIPRSTILSNKDLFLQDEITAWVPENRQEGDDDKERTGWRPVRDLMDLKSAWLLVISPRIAGYSGKAGLELGKPGGPTGIKYKARPLRPAIRYECETYGEHIAYCFGALAGIQLDAAHERMAVLYGWQRTALVQLLLLAVGLHDLGKLSERWQKAIQAWQYDNYPIEGKAANNKPLGHSTYRPGDADREHSPRYERGTHAGEGAAAASPLLANIVCGVFEDEEDRRGALSTILSAIARHHSSQVDKIESYQLLAGAEEMARTSLAGAVPLAAARLETHPGQECRHAIAKMLVGIDNSTVAWLPLYWHLVRQVRLADQEAVKTMVREKGGR